MQAAKICIMRIVDFGLFLPKSASVSAMGNFPHRWESLETFRDQSALLGEHLSKKLPPSSPLQPHFMAKNVLFRVQKSPKQLFFGLLSHGRLDLWAKYSEPKNIDYKNLFYSEL